MRRLASRRCWSPGSRSSSEWGRRARQRTTSSPTSARKSRRRRCSSTRPSRRLPQVTASGRTTSPARRTSTTSSSSRSRCACATRTSCSTSSSSSPSSATGSATATRSRRCAPTRSRVQQGLRRGRPLARRQGPRGAAARVRVLLHDPLPRGPRGRPADRDPARLARGGPRDATTGDRSCAGVGAAIAGHDRDVDRSRRSSSSIAPLPARAARGDHRAARGRRPVRVTLLARLAARAQAPDGVHARARARRRSRPAPASRSPGSASPPSTARASRPCSSTRRSRSSRRASRSGSCSARATAAIALAVVGYAILKLGKRLPLKPMLITAAMLLLAALGRVRRQRGALAAGGRLDRRHAGRRRLGAAAGLPRRADRHPPDGARASLTQVVMLGVYVLGAAAACSSCARRCAAGRGRGRPRVTPRACGSASTSAARSRRPSRSRRRPLDVRARAQRSHDARRTRRRRRRRGRRAARAARAARRRSARASSSSRSRRRRR